MRALSEAALSSVHPPAPQAAHSCCSSGPGTPLGDGPHWPRLAPKGVVQGLEPWRKPVGWPPFSCGVPVGVGWSPRGISHSGQLRTSSVLWRTWSRLCPLPGCAVWGLAAHALTRQRARAAGLQIGVSAGRRLAPLQAWGRLAALVCPERAIECVLQPRPLCHARQGWACDAACLKPAAESSSDPVHLLRSLTPHSAPTRCSTSKSLRF